MEVSCGFLNSGVFDVELLIVADKNRMIHQEPSVIQITVVDSKVKGGRWLGRPPEDIFLKFHWGSKSLKLFDRETPLAFWSDEPNPINP